MSELALEVWSRNKLYQAPHGLKAPFDTPAYIARHVRHLQLYLDVPWPLGWSDLDSSHEAPATPSP